MDRLSRRASVGAFALVVVLAACMCARPVHADALHVVTVAGQAWPEAVEALEADPHAEGRTVALVAADDRGDRSPCGHYELALDGVAKQAFTVGACDTSNGATPLTLAHRSALFGHGQVVPRPLAAHVTVAPRDPEPENASLVWSAGEHPPQVAPNASLVDASPPAEPSTLPPSPSGDASEQSPTPFVRSRVSCAGGLLNPSLLTFLGPNDPRSARVLGIVSVPGQDGGAARADLQRAAVAACADAVSDVVVDARTGRVVALALRLTPPAGRSR